MNVNSSRLAIYCALIFCGLVSGLVSSDPSSGNQAGQAKPVVFVLDVDGTINPAVADHIVKGIQKATERNAQCVVIRMDTPGGAVVTTKTIIKEISNTPLPVVVYVAPSGSSASSAGALITMAADVAAMAPGTNIGAAHPVAGGGEEIGGVMSEKILNDLTAYIRGIVAKKGRNAEWAERSIRESASVTAEEAEKIKVIDIVADSMTDLLNKLDGRTIEKEGRKIVLNTKDATVEKTVHGWRFKILDMVAHPNVAYVLMMVGVAGIMTEVYSPGMIFPGVIGGISLLLALFALQVMPVSYVGLLLLILAVILFVLELKVLSHGLLSIGGIISLTLGSIMLFESEESAMRVSWSVIVPTVAGVSSFFILAMGLALKAWLRPARTGTSGLVGEVGVALTDVDNQGRVSIHGEYWNARSDTHIPKGEKVRVIRVESLSLVVTRDAAA